MVIKIAHQVQLCLYAWVFPQTTGSTSDKLPLTLTKESVPKCCISNYGANSSRSDDDLLQLKNTKSD